MKIPYSALQCSFSFFLMMHVSYYYLIIIFRIFMNNIATSFIFEIGRISIDTLRESGAKCTTMRIRCTANIAECGIIYYSEGNPPGICQWKYEISTMHNNTLIHENHSRGKPREISTLIQSHLSSIRFRIELTTILFVTTMQK